MATVSELHLDFETRSEADLKATGAHQYFDHPSTTILCAAYAFDQEEPEIWCLGDTFPQRVIDHIAAGGTITAWNAAFERLAWRAIMHKRWRHPPVDDTQWRCTMTEAMAMNLPARLKDAAPALGMTLIKDDGGHRLMLKMCKPRNARKGESDLLTLWHETMPDLLRLGDYCMQDVRVEAEIGRRIMRLRPIEQELYMLDMRINDRGVNIDRELCLAAEHIVATATDRVNEEIWRVTEGWVSSTTNTTQLCKWLNARGVVTESVDREHVEDLLILDMPPDCRRALELRQEGSKTSTAKIGAMLRRRQSDGRMRGNLQFYGASATGRWAARGAQLQNLTRPQILGSKSMGDTDLEQQINDAIDTIHKGSSMVVEIVYGQPLTLVADCVRSMICAPRGKILRSSDFSNIEGRTVAWLAGQENKLDAFRAFDDGTGPDLYLVAASGIFNTSINESKPHRQIGKVAELSLGYQGGPRAFAKMAKNYGVRIWKHFDGIWALAEETLKERALEAWEDRGRKTGMIREGWLAAEVVKLAWRQANWCIPEYWRIVEESAIAAVLDPGAIIPCGDYVKFRKVGSFLFCLLPSGRALCYPYPSLKKIKTPWDTDKLQLRYKSVDQFTKRWQEKGFYGGLGVENITQAVSRDLMAEAMLRVDKAGYNVVLTVHDEIVVENEAGFGSMDEFNGLMTEMPVWAKGLPLSVGGWEGERYRKS